MREITAYVEFIQNAVLFSFLSAEQNVQNVKLLTCNVNLQNNLTKLQK